MKDGVESDFQSAEGFGERDAGGGRVFWTTSVGPVGCGPVEGARKVRTEGLICLVGADRRRVVWVASDVVVAVEFWSWRGHVCILVVWRNGRWRAERSSKCSKTTHLHSTVKVFAAADR